MLNAIGSVLLVMGSVLGFWALIISADSEKELESLVKIDLAAGLLVGSGFAVRRSKLRFQIGTWLRAFCAAAFVSGGLAFWHYAVANERWRGPRHVTRNHVWHVWKRLSESYFKDCGEYPSESQGLQAMLTNPGSPGWKGPYIEDPKNLLDGLGRPIRYELKDGKPRVWSVGPDGIDGTSDDIMAPTPD